MAAVGGSSWRPLWAALLVACLVVAAATTARAQSDDAADLLVQEARRALADDQGQRAAALLDRAIAANPRRVDAYILRASIHTARQEYERGVALMRRARQLAPSSIAVLSSLGTQLVLAGQIEEGVGLLEGVVARQPQRYDAHALLGRHYLERGQWEPAVRALRSYLASRPDKLAADDARFAVDLGDAELRRGRAAVAESIFRRVLRRNPEHLRARMGLAWAVAAQDCRRASALLVELAPVADRHPEIWMVSARCALALGHSDRAVARAARYARRRPDDAAGHALAGEAHARAGRLDDARAALSRAIGLAPGERRYLVELAAVERRAGATEAAIARLSQGEPDPSEPLWPRWKLVLAEALLDAGRAAEAEEHAAAVARAAPGRARAHMLLGAARVQSGAPERAIEPLERSVALDGRSRRARALLALALGGAGTAAARAGQDARAEELLSRAVAQEAGDPRVRRALGLVLVRLGRPERAAEILAPIAGGDDAATAHLYGRALAMAGRLAESEGQLARALELAGGRGPAAIPIALDLAATALEAGKPERAAAVLEPFRASDDARVPVAYVSARRALAANELAAGRSARAVTELERAERVVPAGRGELLVAVRCDLAVAATSARQHLRALRILRALMAKKASCPFPPLTLPVLAAINQGLESDAGEALGRLARLRRAAQGSVAVIARQGGAAIALRAAAAAYERGSSQRARQYLREAQRALPAADPHLRHNLAVLDIESGRRSEAIAALSELAELIPEALVNLGVAHERGGNAEAATRYYRRARGRLRFSRLERWIEAKERIYGDQFGR